MRLGGPVFGEVHGPDEWVAAVRAEGYAAAYCPLQPDADAATVQAYRSAAKDANIVIAEVGAWSNPLSPDDEERRQAIQFCQERLELADRVGARCCVNIAGRRSGDWRGPHADNLSDETFDLVVETVRAIIDGVKPTRTFYTLETMPWVFPDSVACYEALIRSIDREEFAVHFDPVNLMCSPQRLCTNGAVIEDFVGKLGARIRSCHAKDIVAEPKLTVHLSEGRPGTGSLDYPLFLQSLKALDPDLPLMLEHLPSRDEYSEAAKYIRSIAQDVGASLEGGA